VPPLAAPYLAAAGLLVVAGVLKLLRPAATVQALRTQSLPSSTALVRLLGAVELAVSGAALAGLPVGAAALAAAYAAFTGFVALALLRGRPLTSCGCFAEPDLPPTWAHPVLTAGLAAVCVAVAVGERSGLPQLRGAGGWLAVGTLAGAVLIGWLAQVVLAELPRLVAASTLSSAPSTTATVAADRPFSLVPVRSAA